ncbi:EamA family transporter [Spongiivirga citrea]|uniref:EamA family transporter n=1 Tax=Spongiivirga citrea TaxID=1481457 RepID=A0A6M0CCX7_9FLAO|nr:EamA family transporter [Spongiivirga citrea]NER15656.1 EamA family transporter [Spongiivirga citrea]
MIYLIVSVLISSLLFVIFKLFEVYKVNTMQAIVVNYIAAATTGFLVYDGNISIAEIPQTSWFWGTVFLGLLFISVFNLMALTSQQNGLSVASVAGKMSVVIPIIFGIWAYKESVHFLKITGIVLALFAVYLTAIKKKSIQKNKNSLLFPFLLFIGSGVIDTAIKYFETKYLPEGGIPIFSATIFAFAAIIGISILTIKGIRGKLQINLKNVVAGICLGIPNYYSIYFLLKALNTEGLESSTLFTINNVGIVMLTTLCGLLLFKEKLIPKNWYGIVLAIVSIIIISFA